MDEHLSRYLERELSPQQRRDATSGMAGKRNAVLLLFAFLGAYGCMSFASNSIDQAVAEQHERERPRTGWEPDGRTADRSAAERRAHYEQQAREAERRAAATWQNDPTSYGSD